MKQFDFLNAPNIETALYFLHEHGERALLVAGGTNVCVDIRAGKFNDRALISIRDVAALNGISLEDGVISIGASTTLAAIAQSELLKEHAPCLYMAANVFADPTTRNSATIGGNIANASPAADTAPPLMALGAAVHTLSSNGAREIAIDEFFVGVGRTSLNPDELITHLTFSPAKSGYVKLGLRNAMAISVVSAAAVVENENGIIKRVRVALGSVAPTPVRARHVENALVGKRFNEDTIALAAEMVQHDVRPIDDIRASANYRRQVAPVVVKRALRLAVDGDCLWGGEDYAKSY